MGSHIPFAGSHLVDQERMKRDREWLIQCWYGTGLPRLSWL